MVDLEICGHGHPQVAYQGDICPVCAVIEKLEDKESTIDMLESELAGYEPQEEV